MIYTATTPALAVLEVLAHVAPADAPEDLVLIALHVDGPLIEEVRVAQLPAGWDAVPFTSVSQAFGDAWIASGRSVGLCVPSVVAPASTNVLLNPDHAQISAVAPGEVSDVRLDPRLLRSGS